MPMGRAIEPDDMADESFTLLGVRADGIASIVDLMATESLPDVRLRAEWLLREHASCSVVEVWRDGALVEQLARPA